jgi:hypothetical protein
MKGPLDGFRDGSALGRWLVFLSLWERELGHEVSVPAVMRTLALDTSELDNCLRALELLPLASALRGLDPGMGGTVSWAFGIDQRRWALTTLQHLQSIAPPVMKACQSAFGRRWLLAHHLVSLCGSASLHKAIIGRLLTDPGADSFPDGQLDFTGVSPMRGQLPAWLWDSLLGQGLPQVKTSPELPEEKPQNMDSTLSLVDRMMA